MLMKNFSQVVQRLIAEILASQPDANVTTGTLARDIVIDPPAYEFADIYAAIDYVQQQQAILLAADSGLERLLENFSLVRKDATRATGTAWFRRVTAPSVDLVVPIGTRVATSATILDSAREFVTTETVVMLASQADCYWNQDAGFYEIEARIEAVEPGDESNIGAGTVIVLSGISNFTAIYNKKPTTGGTAQEGDDSFRFRGLNVLSGNAIGTADGLKVLAEQESYVSAACIVTPNPTTGVRIKDGGGADIFIRTTLTQETSELYAFPEGEVRRYLTAKPVTAVTAVKADTTYLVPEFDYSVELNNDAYGRSVFSPDSIRWVTARTPGEQIEIIYSYAQGVRSLQDLINQRDKHIVGVDLLSRLAYYATVDVDATLELFAGYNASAVVNNAVTVITTYINSLGVGEEVQESDIVAALEAVSGVDSVVIPFAIFSVTREISGITDDADEIEGESTGTVTSNLKIRENEYAVAGTVTVRYY